MARHVKGCSSCMSAYRRPLISLACTWLSARMTTAGPRHWSMSMRAANLRAKRALLHLGRLPFVMWLVMYFLSTAVPEIIH